MNKFCFVYLLQTGERNFFHPIFSQPGKSLLVQPYNIEANASPLKSMEEEDVFISATNTRRHRTLERATIWWYLTILWCTRVTESNENLHSIWAFAHTFIPFFYHYPAPPQIGEFQCQSSPDREVFEVYPYHSKILDHIFQFRHLSLSW